MFTAGTAGAPKAAMLTHGNLLANLEQIRARRERQVADDVIFGVLPLFHIFGLNVVLGLALLAGSTRRARSSASTRRPRSRPSSRTRSP